MEILATRFAPSFNIDASLNDRFLKKGSYFIDFFVILRSNPFFGFHIVYDRLQ